MRKLGSIGFVDVDRGEELPYGIEECALYPVFTSELLELMRRLIPRERWTRVARSVIFVARKASVPAGQVRRAPPSESTPAEGTVEHDDTMGLPRPDAMWDFGAAGCEEGVLLRIRNLLAGLAPGQILEIRSMDPGVREDLPAWCRMTAQEYLGASGSRYFVKRR